MTENGKLELTNEQRERLSRRIGSLVRASIQAPSGMSPKRWRQVKRGEISALDVWEIRAISDCIPGTLFSLGLSSDPLA